MSLDISYNGGVFSAPQAKSVGTVTAGTGPYNLAVASYDGVSFSVASQATSPNSLWIKDDGLTMYVIGPNSDSVIEYSLSTAWDITTASHTASTSIYAQERTAHGFFFRSDGTKMYIVGSYGVEVNEYDLTTAWDSTTISHVRAQSVSSQDSTPTDIWFNTDGTKMFILGNIGNDVNEYSLSTAWDVSTISYTRKFSVSAQAFRPQGMFMNPDGTKMWIIEYNSDEVHEYDLTTGFDLSTASYNNVQFSVATEESIPLGLYFKNDGSKMYIIGGGSDTIYQYSTGTATTLDLSTGNYFSHTPSANTTFAFSNAPASGTAAGFALALTGANVVEGYDLANASYDSVSFSVGTQDTVPTGLTFSTDGTNAYVAGPSQDKVFQYTLSTAWDLSTASYANKSLTVSGQALLSGAIAFKNDGTSLYVLDRNLDDVFQYDLTTAWDVSTASYASKSMDATSQDTAPRGMYFKPDGTKVYIAGDTNASIFQYALSTAWDISTGSYESKSFSVNTQTAYPCGVYLSPDGYKMFVAATTEGDIFQYSLSTAWDVSTASYDSVSFDASTQVTTGLHDLYFKSDGSKMYLISVSTDTVYQYTTGSSATATFTYPSSVKFPSGTAPAGPAIGETDVLVFYTDDGGTTYQGFKAGDAMA